MMADDKINSNPKGFFLDQMACIGCRTCQVACKDTHDLDVGMLFRRVDTYEVGDFPHTAVYHLSRTCNNCKEPACVAVCPSGAMYINQEDGTVQHDDDLCIGCQYCVKACPYEVPQFDVEKSIAAKCDSCIVLRGAGEDPACVSSCIMRALEFGAIEDLRAAHPDAVDVIDVLPDPEQTSPSLLIQPRPAAIENGSKKMLV